jgi:hypothetical protein
MDRGLLPDGPNRSGTGLDRWPAVRIDDHVNCEEMPHVKSRRLGFSVVEIRKRTWRVEFHSKSLEVGMGSMEVLRLSEAGTA